MNYTEIYAKRAQAYLDGKNPDFQETFWIPTPGQIALFSSVLIDVIKAIRGCVSNEEEALKVMHNPNHFQKGVLKRITRRRVGWFKYYNPFGKDYVKAVEKTGKDVSHKDAGAIWNEKTK